MLLNRIELFVTVARHHNLGKTAREMHVSASSVCQRLKSLENDFGVKLYKKNKEGIELTGAGETLLTTGSDVLNQLENLRKTLNPCSETAVQSLTIGGTYNPSAKYLPSAIAAFQKTHPNVKVTISNLQIDRVSKNWCGNLKWTLRLSTAHLNLPIFTWNTLLPTISRFSLIQRIHWPKRKTWI